VLLWIGVVMTLAGTLSTSFLFGTLPAEIALALSAVPTTGRVVDVRETDTVVNSRYVHEISFEYVVDGKVYVAAVDVTHPALIEELSSKGQEIPVEYAEFYPRFARIRGVPLSVMGWPRLFFLITPVLGVSLLFVAWRSNRREIRAFRVGIPTVGRIVERTVDTSVREGNRSPRVVRWEFTVGGTEYRGELSNMDWVTLDEALPGPWVIVLYDPKDPRRNTAYIS